MYSYAIFANELGELTTEGERLCRCRALLAKCLCLPFRPGHLAVQVLQPLHEEGRLEPRHAAERETRLPATLGAVERPASRASRHLLDAGRTVVVVAGKQFDLLVVIMAHTARDLSLQLIQRLLPRIWTFRHLSTKQELEPRPALSVKYCARA